MKDRFIPSSLIPVGLDQSPRVILFFMVNIVLHAEAKYHVHGIVFGKQEVKPATLFPWWSLKQWNSNLHNRTLSSTSISSVCLFSIICLFCTIYLPLFNLVTWH